MKRLALLAGLLLAAAALPAGQNPPPKPTVPTQDDQKPQVFRVGTTLVNVPFSVLDAKDKLVVDLKREDFRVFEDGKEMEIAFFSPITTIPLRIGMLMDTSNSVRLYFKAQQTAAIDFVHEILGPKRNNKIFLMTFDFTKDFLTDFTDDPDRIASLVRKLKPGGGTALFDAIYKACEEKLKHQAEVGGLRRVLVLLTDGEDDASKHSMEQTIQAAQRAGVSIYAIATISFGYNSPGEPILEELASKTGGRVVYPWKKPPSAEYATGYLSRTQIDGQNAVYQEGSGKYSSEQAETLAQALGLIQRELQQQYSLAYVAPNPAVDGKFRAIRVEIAHKGLRVRARPGYYPPLFE
jgi:hypothetical protein